MPKTTLSRLDLYKLIWSKSLHALSLKYFISDSELRKVCKRMDIPIPYYGYWSKLQFGKEVNIVPLPENYTGSSKISLWMRDDIDGEEYFENSNMINKTKKAAINLENKAITDKHIINHPLIISTKKYYSMKIEDRWTNGDELQRLNIDVSDVLFNRAIQIMSKFIMLMKSKGYNVIVEYNTTFAILSEFKQEISIKEKSNRLVRKNGRYNEHYLVRNGTLSFRIGRGYYLKEWLDNSILIEDKIQAIIAQLEFNADEMIKYKIQCEEREKERKEKDRIAKEYQIRKELELRYFKDLFINAKRYQQANEIRNYIKSVETHAKEKATYNEKTHEWIDWALKKADWYDPFIDSKDELLDDVDKNSISFL